MSLDEDRRWLYFSQSFSDRMCKICEMCAYSSGPSKGTFSTRTCQNTSHPSHLLKQHANSNCYQRLDLMITGVKKINLNKKQMNQLYIRKCIYSIDYMVSKNMVLSDNYRDLMKFTAYTFEDLITKQYLDTCPKNATYISNTTESIIDAVNFYFQSNTLTKINGTGFKPLYADETENSFHKECLSMFVTHFSQDSKELAS